MSGSETGERVDADAGASALGYETEDVQVGKTWLIVAGLGVTVAVAIAGLGWMMRDFTAARQRALPPLTPQQTVTLTPPPPNLQSAPFTDIDITRSAEAALLRGYAYTDAARRRARIPIDRAMALTVGKPLDP